MDTRTGANVQYMSRHSHRYSIKWDFEREIKIIRDDIFTVKFKLLLVKGKILRDAVLTAKFQLLVKGNILLNGISNAE